MHFSSTTHVFEPLMWEKTFYIEVNVLAEHRSYIASINQLPVRPYRPFEFLTQDCTPGIHGRLVVFLSWSLDFMHLFFISCLLTYLFDVSIVLVWKKWVKSDKLWRLNIRLSKMYVHTGGAFTAKLSKLLKGLQLI